MKLNIIKIKLSQLESFVNSDTFRSFKTIPISLLRVKSYIANPNALPDDIVLYMGFHEEKLIAFRTIFAGSVQTNNGNLRFGWCSGSWVEINYRRRGFSEQLLIEALFDWKGKLMVTNYAPNAERLFLKTGKFSALHQFNGFRGYLFVKTTKLVPLAKKNNFARFTFAGIDVLISVVAGLRGLFFRSSINRDISFSQLERPDDECYQWLGSQINHCTLQRGVAELRWIFNFPWISLQASGDSAKYPFSLFSDSFTYHTIKVFRNNIFIGFFIFSVRDGHLKTLLFELNSGAEKEIADYIAEFCIQQKIEVITVYNSGVAEQLFKRKLPFLRAKKYGQKIYSSFDIGIQQNLKFQDGDGDVIFT